MSALTKLRAIDARSERLPGQPRHGSRATIRAVARGELLPAPEDLVDGDKMSGDGRLVLVLGATGQQGGSVAAALREDGWQVRALVRDPGSARAGALAATGVELVRGDLADLPSVEAAAADAHGVFSVQPSSGQGTYDVSDADEVRFGIGVADAAISAGVKHLVYSSSSAAGANTGVGHFDSKWQVEEHVRRLGTDTTVVRPNTFMEMLLLPDFGLPDGGLTFFMRPDQTMQFIAVEDIGKIVAAIFADPATHRGRTLEIAGDGVTGEQLAASFARASGRPVTYERFPDVVLGGSSVLGGLARLVDEGPLAGAADIDALRALHPGLQSFAVWLEGPAKAPLEALLRTRDQ